MSNEQSDRFLDVLSACIILRGGALFSREELKKRTLKEILDICSGNRISMKASLPELVDYKK